MAVAFAAAQWGGASNASAQKLRPWTVLNGTMKKMVNADEIAYQGVRVEDKQYAPSQRRKEYPHRRPF